jgi:hypothetical protein
MTVVYVQNRSLHRILKNMTPKEAFFEKKSSVEHLRIFGYPVYIHVPKDKRKKLEPSGKKDSYLTRLGFSNSYANALVILLLYVDDLFLTGAKPLIIQFKRELASEFDMKDLGLMHYYLGLEV